MILAEKNAATKGSELELTLLFNSYKSQRMPIRSQLSQEANFAKKYSCNW